MRAPTELSFASNGTRLVASIDCEQGPGLLESGKIGWRAYSSEVPWRLGWTIKVQSSLTQTQPNYGLGEPALDREEATGAVFRLLGRPYIFSQDYIEVKVFGKKVDIAFLLPDCIDEFKRGGWGYSDGGPIHLDGSRYHCQTRLILRPPNHSCSLAWEQDEELHFKRALLFEEATGAVTRLLERLEVSKPPDPKNIEFRSIKWRKQKRD